jgi:hypothetical protein
MAQKQAADDAYRTLQGLADDIREQYNEFKTVSAERSSGTLLLVANEGVANAPDGLLDLVADHNCAFKDEQSTALDRYVAIVETEARRRAIVDGRQADPVADVEAARESDQEMLRDAARTAGGALIALERNRQTVANAYREAFENPEQTDIGGDLLRTRAAYREAHSAVFALIVGDVDKDDAPALAEAHLLTRPGTVDPALREARRLVDILTRLSRHVSPFGPPVADVGLAEKCGHAAATALGNAQTLVEALEIVEEFHPTRRSRARLESMHDALRNVTFGDMVSAEFDGAGDDGEDTFWVTEIGRSTNSGLKHGFAVKLRKTDDGRNVGSRLYTVNVPKDTEEHPFVESNQMGGDWQRHGTLEGFEQMNDDVR